MSYVPEKGDIVRLDFDPSAGKEIMKRRPGFVLSRKLFNEHTGFAIVAPITSTRRGMALEVPLTGTQTTGTILIHQMRSLDYESRSIELLEKAPEEVTSKATELSLAIIR